MNGYLNIVKPPGMTSSDVVVFLRRIIKPGRIGHAGTLDPDAAGVLPIMLGKATRLFDYLNVGSKKYIAEFTFGTATDTIDASGNVTARDNKTITKDQVLDALPCFSGEIEQIPPMISAISVNGRRAYDLARQGHQVDLPPRRIEVHSIRLLNHIHRNKFLFQIECSKGTYIRSLCRDLAHKLGSCAYTSFLLRTKSGYFDIDGSISIQDAVNFHCEGLLDGSLVPIDKPIGYLPRIDIDRALYKQAVNGAMLDAPYIFQGAARAYCGDSFIGLAEMRTEGEMMSIFKVLAEQQ